MKSKKKFTSRSFKNSWVFLAKARSEKPSSSSSWSIGSTTTGLSEDVKKKQPSVQRRIAAWAPGFRTNSTTPSLVDWPRSFAITMARSICQKAIGSFEMWDGKITLSQKGALHLRKLKKLFPTTHSLQKETSSSHELLHCEEQSEHVRYALLALCHPILV